MRLLFVAPPPPFVVVVMVAAVVAGISVTGPEETEDIVF